MPRSNFKSDFRLQEWDKITDAAYEKMFRSPVLESRTLRQNLRTWYGSANPGKRAFESSIYVPHYWARYYHDGRGRIRPKTARNLIWFKDPKQDPRIASGYPVFKSQIKRLTGPQFRKALAADQLVIAKSSGPAIAHPFMSNTQLAGKAGGMRGFRKQVDKFIVKDADNYVEKSLRGLGLWNTKETIEF